MKTYKKLILATIICTNYMQVSAQTPTRDSLTMNQIFNLVDKNSKAIQISRSEILSKDFRLKDAKSDRLPSLSIFAEVDKASNMPVYSNGIFNKPEQHDVIHTLYQSGANLYFNLYNGLKTKNSIGLAKLESTLSQAELEEKIGATKLKAAHLFFDLYLQRSWINLMQADIEEKTEQAKEIKHLYDKGVILESDVIRANLEISKRKLTLLEIENDVQIINQQLNVLIGETDLHVIIPQLDVLPLSNDDLETALEVGKKNNYQEKISKVHVELAEKKISLAKSGNAIQLGLVGSFQFSNPQIFLYPYNASWYSLGIIGLKASYNISSLYHNRKKVLAAQNDVYTEHIEHEKVRDDIRTQIFEAYHHYQEAQAHVEIKTKNVEYAKENLRILKNAYFSKSSLITDLLDANLLSLKALFELKQAQINVFKSYYTLTFSKGNL